ncbi:MAG: SLBB domain-containing protein [Bacteroidota bacterium]|nr:SLBB domain-containing protein [Bacteroidota bacterium]
MKKKSHYRSSPIYLQTIILLIFLFISNSVQSQDRKQTTPSRDLFPFETDKRTQDKTFTSLDMLTGIALEATIDPEKYFVGPSDIIAVNIWLSPPLSFPLVVTPEGTLIVPTVGEVKVADLTLAEVKVKILQEARKKYISAEITTTLLRPRPIIVTIVGNVLNEGIYTLNASDRVTKAIEEANKPTRLQMQGEVNSKMVDMSTRNIVLKHGDGTLDRVDIAKYLVTKDDKWNPYLREGDVVIVPRKSLTKNIFAVYGEVNVPGRYEFIEGDSLLDAIEIGMGLTQRAVEDSIQFTRLNPEGTEISSSIISLNEIKNRNQPNIPLEPGDRIIVRSKKEIREDYRVDVQGEVFFPGFYPITKNGTRLTQVIRQAGGFTEFAALKAAVIIRKSMKPSEHLTDMYDISRGSLLREDVSYFNLENEVRLRREIVSVDFEKLFAKNDSSQDVIVQDGDAIIIPSLQKTVYIFGQVLIPGHLSFVQGMDLDYYIKKVDGFTEDAQTSDIKIIKARTKQWLSPDDTTIEEGDYIWVPKKPERTFQYYLTVASQAANVVSILVGVVIITLQIVK